MKLKKLLKEIPDIVVKGSKEVEITGICTHSQSVAPGSLFIAKKGLTQNGTRFIEDAVAAGAVAILSDVYNPFFPEVVQLIHPDVEAIEEKLAQHYYASPADALFLVGITGTNGKTTTAYMIKHLLEGLGKPCGLIGTVEWIVGKNILPSTYTTPDLLTNYKLFYEMKKQGCIAAVMEVSSHGLDQNRVGGIEFDAAIFTNLTQDHLDYHKDMENYAKTKAKLFSSLSTQAAAKSFEKVAIVNADDPYKEILLKDCKAKVLTYGIHSPADVRASDLKLTARGIQCTLSYQEQKIPFSCTLIGKFNVYNCLAAIALGLSLSEPLEKVATLLHSFKRVSGRLEKVPNPLGLHLFVDYAHTDDALKNVLETLQEIKKGKLITVFGCGGNRDKGKREKMGEVAEKLSDVVLLTSDNPRNESPEEIVQDILKGCKMPSCALVELDRRKAIRRAVEIAEKEDIVLIAGKGHESYQIFSHKTIDFDDRKVAYEETVSLAERRSSI